MTVRNISFETLYRGQFLFSTQLTILITFLQSAWVMKDTLSFYLDIYGLLLFLGVDPYCHQKWWKSLLFEPYRNGDKQPLYELLAKILWRSVKKDVIHEVLFSKVFRINISIWATAYLPLP